MTDEGSSPSASKREAYALFERLLEGSEEDRARTLTDLAATHPELHRRVVALLEADRRAPTGLFRAGGALGAVESPSVLSEGGTVGAYRLERRLGHGGMGEVWLARRLDGVSAAPVAVKLLHGHLVQSAARSRFLREGRILGEMTHAHVARLLDAGIAASGQPYLALEYIEGDRLDRWCDQRRLDIASRLGLLLQVCDAVAHAHAHLAVHRDLKPSNILVSGDGDVKLLDFGIAKLLDAGEGGFSETELTRIGDRAMTPEYAAPEQISGGAITTATDVYALGVLLYLLLSGRRPYGSAGDSPSQLERAVIEVEPRSLSQARTTGMTEIEEREIAAVRSTTPRKLREQLRGDLETIVAKALKKASADRYPTVVALADDLRRYLAQEPVLARPDSLGYRAGKFLRRHRVAMGAATAIAASLIGGIGVALWQAQRAEQQSMEAREQARRVKQTKDFFVSIFANADPRQRSDDAPLTVAGALDDALERLDTDLADDPRLQAELLSDLGDIRGNQGQLAEAKTLLERALALQERVLPPDDPAIGVTLGNLAAVVGFTSQPSAARPYFQRAVTILELHADTHGSALANARIGMATVYNDAGDRERTAAFIGQALAYYRTDPGDKHLNLVGALGSMGNALLPLQRFEEARADYEECIAVVERYVGPNSASMSNCLSGLVRVARHDGDVEQQSAYAERALKIARANFAGDSPWLAAALADLGAIRVYQKRHEEADTLLGEALAMFERMGGNLMQKVMTLRSLAQNHDQSLDYAGAVQWADRGLAACAQQTHTVANDNCKTLQSVREHAVAALQVASPPVSRP